MRPEDIRKKLDKFAIAEPDSAVIYHVSGKAYDVIERNIRPGRSNSVDTTVREDR